jgi:hypothetical protein
MNNLNEQVMALDLDNLSDEQRMWLHDLKNKAMVALWRKQLNVVRGGDYMDKYGSSLREENKRVMEQPSAPFRPLNRREEPFLRIPRIEHRAQSIANKIRRLWWNWSDALGQALWWVVAFMVFVGLVWIYGVSR